MNIKAALHQFKNSLKILWTHIKILRDRFKSSLFLLWLKIKAALHQFKNYLNIVWGQIKVLLHRFKNSLFLLWLKIKAALHQFKNYLNVLWGQIKTLLHRFKNYLFSRWVRIKLSIPILQEKIGLIVIIKGGLKLKLIGSAVIIILFTIITLSSIIIYLMKNAIEQKAIEVATTSIERIADFSNHALLERSYENRLTLNEMIKDIRLSKIEGMLDISIYQHVKTKKVPSSNI